MLHDNLLLLLPSLKAHLKLFLKFRPLPSRLLKFKISSNPLFIWAPPVYLALESIVVAATGQKLESNSNFSACMNLFLTLWYLPMFPISDVYFFQHLCLPSWYSGVCLKSFEIWYWFLRTRYGRYHTRWKEYQLALSLISKSQYGLVGLHHLVIL